MHVRVFEIKKTRMDGTVKLRATLQIPRNAAVIDLGFFISIQRLEQIMSRRSVEMLVGVVENAFKQLPSFSIYNPFLPSKQW